MAHFTENLKFGALLLMHHERASALPLEETRVEAAITGPTAEIVVTQSFKNPFPDPVELRYLFPLPHDAMITQFIMRIGDHEIPSQLQELGEAQRRYATARESGQLAALMQGERPDLFSLQLTHVRPGENIRCRIHYHQILTFEKRGYEFVFPMGLTPKFHTDPSRAERLDSPLALAGEPIGPAFISVLLDTTVPVTAPESPSHRLSITPLDDHHLRIEPADPIIPDKDFVLRYRLDVPDLHPLMWTAQEGSEAVILASVPPPPLHQIPDPPPREFLFVLDRSGSMSGQAIQQACNALAACLRSLSDKDTFTILGFNTELTWFAPRPLPFQQNLLAAADDFLDHLEACGGTDILLALRSALALPLDRERGRCLVFLTDGAVSADKETLALLDRHTEKIRLFAFGIGPSVNRFLITHMAEQGRGKSYFLQLDEDIEEAILRFQDHISFPVLQDLSVHWQNFRVSDQHPQLLSDLYEWEPLTVVCHGRFVNAEPAELILQGKAGDQLYAQRVMVPPASRENPALTRFWARKQIEKLITEMELTPSPSGKLHQQIVDLSLRYSIQCPLTAFIALAAESEPVRHGPAPLVQVATPLPEGLEWTGFVGMRDATAYASILPHFRPQRIVMKCSRQIESAGKSITMKKIVREVHSQSGLSVWMKKLAGRPEAKQMLSLPDPQDVMQTLRWLIRQQKSSGAFGDSDEQVEVTAAVLLAFVRNGFTVYHGFYRKSLLRAYRWLMDHPAHGWVETTRLQALGEMATAIDDQALLSTLPSDWDQRQPAQPTDAAISSAAELKTAALQQSGGRVPAGTPATNLAQLVWQTVLASEKAK